MKREKTKLLEKPADRPDASSASGPNRKVAFFLPALYGGGAERIILTLARGFASRGFPVDLVLARREGPYLSEVPGDIRIVDLHTLRDRSTLPALARYLRRERPFALLSGLHTNLIALWAKSLARVSTRVIVAEHNTLSARAGHYSSDARMRWMPRLIRWFYPRAHGIVAVSEGVAEDLARMTGIPREGIRTILNPIVTPELRAKAAAPLDHPWFGAGQPPVILAVGRLTAQKDFATLIKALALVRETQPARLLILGEGEDRPGLEALAASLGLREAVLMPGFVANPYAYMVRARLFVLSSKWEGLPSVLIEAMFCGCPVVSTDCPSGPKEILHDGRYGRLVPIGDAGALAASIAAALRGEIPPPPPESWHPFEMERAVEAYRAMILE